MNLVTCTAAKSYDATPMDGLKAHAVDLDTGTEHPLCTKTLGVLGYTPAEPANADTVTCKRCAARVLALTKESK